jgi:hypothetical protein
MSTLKKECLPWIVLLTLSLNISSCGSDGDDDGFTPENVDNSGNTNNGSTVLNVGEQKEFLEATGKEALNYFNSTEFDNLKSIADVVSDYDTDKLEDWAEDALDACTQEVSSKGYFKRILSAAQYSGHFTVKSGKWVEVGDASANELRFSFTANNKNYEFTVNAGGAEKQIFISTTEEDGYWNGRRYEYDEYDNYVVVPEHIVAKLTENGSTLVESTINIDLSSVTGNEIDLSCDALSVTMESKINDYVITLSKCSYKPESDTGIQVTTSIKKSGTSILSATLTSGVSGYDEDKIDWEEADFGDLQLKGCKVSVDLLGKVQIKGLITDLVTFANNLNEAENIKYEDSKSGTRFKGYVKNANDCITNASVYYNGTSVKQATFYIESFYEEAANRYASSHWEYEPVIKFSDESTYNTISTFFSEINFSSLVKTFNNLVDDYESKYGNY